MSFLESDECLEKVSNQIAEARAKGVSGVPFTIIDGKWAVSGSQTAPVFVKVRTTQECPIIFPNVTSPIDFQQAIGNPYRTAITVDYTCTGYGCRSGMIMYFFISLFRSRAPLFIHVGR